jgi:hypothetical protein
MSLTVHLDEAASLRSALVAQGENGTLVEVAEFAVYRTQGSSATE